MLTGFSDKQIISMLKTNSLWCKRACKEILRRPNDFIPSLLDILDIAIDDYELSVCDYYSQHIPAALLLSQLREPQAYPRLIKLIDCDKDDLEYLWGDMITENYPWMLRDTFNGDFSLLGKLIEDRTVAEWSRAVALIALGMHYFDSRVSREEITGFFRHLIHEVYTGKPDTNDKLILSYIADVAREQQLEELIADVLTIYSRDGIDMLLCGTSKEYVEEFGDPLFKAKDKHVNNTISELQTWRWFEPKEPEEEDYDEEDNES
jgi:hypothetical protein